MYSIRNPLSRQSTNESNDSDTTPTQSYMTSTVTSSATIGSDKQPIKKSPREFIIPISVEGGGVVTPRANSIEQSESNLTQSSSMSGKRISRPRRISSIFKEDSEEESTVFPKLNRHTSIGRESDSEEPRFHSMHRLRYVSYAYTLKVKQVDKFVISIGVHVPQNVLHQQQQLQQHKILMNLEVLVKKMMMMVLNC